jgi:signal transduction histidine kinase
VGIAVVAAHAFGAAPAAASPVRGLPATRLYTFEEIGNVTRDSQLTFDSLGRIALVKAGEFVVLNDSTWLNLADEERGGIQVLATTCDRAGSTYYGALGSWGRMVPTASGRLRPAPLVPDTYPPWVLATNFVEILPTATGVFFAGWNGIVYWDRETGRNTFFELPSLARLWTMGDAVFASSHERGVQCLDTAAGTMRAAEGFAGSVVDHVAPLEGGRLLVSTTNGELQVYADGRLARWRGPLVGELGGRVSALRKLVDGDIAVAVTGRGLFIADEDGAIRTALTTVDYHRVVHLANNEPGVLWAVAESGIAKVLYGNPVSLVGQALGLPVWFPQIVRWREEIVVASAGRLYAPVPAVPGAATRFELLAGQPGSGAWAIAAQGDELLVGNRDGVFVREDDAGFVPVLADIDVARLVFIAPDLCVVLGAHEIAALRREGEDWVECAARVPGLGYPFMVHASRRAAWIELGADRVARVSWDEGCLRVRVFDTFPWSDPRWVHVSVLDDTVILAGPPDLVFFDERAEEFDDAPELRKLLERAPYWVARVCRDEEGILLASHGHGVLAIVPQDGGHVFDTATYDVIDDQAPLVRTVPGHGIWASTGATLYHIAQRQEFRARRGLAPTLVSLRDRRTSAELLRGATSPRALGRLEYRQNSLDFLFFAGSYASRRPPTYEVRMDDHPWTSLGSNSLFTLSDLREGSYSLDVRLMSRDGVAGPAVSYRFAIAPPWYRSWFAVLVYAVSGAVVLLLVNRLSVRRARARSAELEQVVAARTKELKATMERLREETETSATLAERNRLAGEIHDSLEQGFTGLALQLETTAEFPSCSPEVRSGLATALSMVAFGRNELRHVVRDLHSALLDTANLETALRQLVLHATPDPHYAEVVVEGAPRKLGSTIEHHLLRIAQEAVTNAVKHAAATRLTLTLAFTECDVQLTIADNGRGFDAGSLSQSGQGHFGLPGLRGRARVMGASLAITSQPGAGTRITVRVPLSRPPATSPARLPH